MQKYEEHSTNPTLTQLLTLALLPESRETHSLSRASTIYGHKAFQITHLHATVYMPLLSVAAQHLLNTAHTLWGCAVELASALSTATILADAAVTPTISEMTYNVSSGTLNHSQPIKPYFLIWFARFY